MNERIAFNQHIERQPYMPRQHGEVLNPQEFLHDFGHEATKADEVFSAVMVLETGAIGAQVIDVFNNAPRKAKKTMVFDSFSQMVSSDGLILAPYSIVPWRRTAVQNRRKEQQELIERLETTGTEVVISNEETSMKDRLFPFMGRSHLKISYVVKKDGTQVAYIHTHNFQNSPSAEITVKFTREHAQGLISEYNSVITNPPDEDYKKQLTDDLWIFVDSGKPGKSIILNEGIQLVQRAEQSIQVCSQLPPTGDFGRALAEAYAHEIDVEAITTKRRLEGTLYTDNNIMYLVGLAASISSKMQGSEYPLYQDPYRNMHAKLILKDVFTDDAEADFGSHNYAASGVKAGTREVQVRSTDKSIIKALHRRFKDFKLVANQDHT